MKQAVGDSALPSLDRSLTIVKQFVEAMDDDFNTARAIAVLYELSTETNTALTSNEKQRFPMLLTTWNALAGDVLGILPTSYQSASSDVSDTLMQLIIRWRKEARDRRDFVMSDSIRKELEEARVVLEDSKEGTTWRLK